MKRMAHILDFRSPSTVSFHIYKFMQIILVCGRFRLSHNRDYHRFQNEFADCRFYC